RLPTAAGPPRCHRTRSVGLVVPEQRRAAQASAGPSQQSAQVRGQRLAPQARNGPLDQPRPGRRFAVRIRALYSYERLRYSSVRRALRRRVKAVATTSARTSSSTVGATNTPAEARFLATASG